MDEEIIFISDIEEKDWNKIKYLKEQFEMPWSLFILELVNHWHQTCNMSIASSFVKIFLAVIDAPDPDGFRYFWEYIEKTIKEYEEFWITPKLNGGVNR